MQFQLNLTVRKRFKIEQGELPTLTPVSEITLQHYNICKIEKCAKCFQIVINFFFCCLPSQEFLNKGTHQVKYYILLRSVDLTVCFHYKYYMLIANDKYS